MSKTFQKIIEEKYPQLSKSHRRIADYINGNYEKAAFMTAAKLGAEDPDDIPSLLGARL